MYVFIYLLHVWGNTIPGTYFFHLFNMWAGGHDLLVEVRGQLWGAGSLPLQHRCEGLNLGHHILLNHFLSDRIQFCCPGTCLSHSAQELGYRCMPLLPAHFNCLISIYCDMVTLHSLSRMWTILLPADPLYTYKHWFSDCHSITVLVFNWPLFYMIMVTMHMNRGNSDM